MKKPKIRDTYLYEGIDVLKNQLRISERNRIVKRHTDGGGFGELISVNSPLRSRRIQLGGTLIAA